MPLYAVILCAGKSSRTGGKRQKGLLPVLGTPVVRYVASAVSAAKPSKTVAVVGFQSEAVVECLSSGGFSGAFDFRFQKRQAGTGHALSAGLKAITAQKGDALVINGDMPAVTGALIKKLVAKHKKSRAAVSFATADAENPSGYGRVVRGRGGRVEKIVEQADADAKEKRICEINAGIYCFKIPFLKNAVKKVRNKNAKGEYYITDLVEIALRSGEKTETVKAPVFGEIAGVNTPEQFSFVQTFIRERVNAGHLRRGVVIADPATTHICPETKIGKGTFIHPCCFINRSEIGENCSVEPCCDIKNSKIGANCAVEFSSSLDGCSMKSGAKAGPFARIRPGTALMEGAKAGSFVEIKKSAIGKHSKVPHLSYVGDSEIGSKVNIGAGTITCNYDGTAKHKTAIDDGAFIGSDTMLVAPVKIGKGAMTAAGSVITKDVPERSLAIGRSKQKNARMRGGKN